MALKIQPLQPARPQTRIDVAVVLSKATFDNVPATQVFLPYFQEALPGSLEQSGYFASVEREGRNTLSPATRTILVVPHIEANVVIDSNVLLSCCLGATIIGLVVVFGTPIQAIRTQTTCTFRLYDVTNLTSIETLDSQTRQSLFVYSVDGLEPIATLRVQSNSISKFSPFDNVKVIAPNHKVTAQNLAFRVAEAMYSALKSPTDRLPEQVIHVSESPSDNGLPEQAPDVRVKDVALPATSSAATPLSPGNEAVQSQKNRNTALILEILPGLIGLLGIGWIYSGKTNTGVIILIGMLIWDLISIVLLALTAGFSGLCTLPINVALIALSAYLLNSYTKEHSELFL